MTAVAADLSAHHRDRQSELADALAAVRSRLAAAAEAANRNVAEIELLPITKFFPATDVAILSVLGCPSVGESRAQEAAAKVGELARLLSATPRSGHRHMVGRIQRNKARSISRSASTATCPAASSTSRRPARLTRSAPVEASDALELVDLMGIPPLDWDPDEAFARLQSEHHRVRRSCPNAAGLPAGVSSDLESAIQHGSTCVRVGTAQTGPRPLRSP